ncbi:MAG TPA: zinc-ribbon domain-containing protein [Polyangiaceae bacterium]
MKITCQACAAKYTIADEKVLGKVVKIRCKKCGATIVVNGNDPAAASSGAAAAAAPAYDYAQQGAGGEAWTVNVADGDQRTMSDQEVADAYHAGVVTDETFCWKDGMTDWLPLREIEPLYAACTSTRAMPPPSAMPAPRHSDMPTRIQDTGGLVLGGGAAPAPAPYVPPMAAAPADPGNGGGMFTDASPVAARRAGGRAATADLFSGAAQAGSEEDVLTSAPAGIPQAHQDDQQKLTGARNENSVLFSLNALTSKGPGGGGAPMPATSEASGLIDIKQLGAQIGLGSKEKKRSAVDDIMNLAGGGAFSPSLSAPVLSAPPIEEYAPQPEAAAAALPGPAPKNKLVIFGAIGAGVVVIALAVGAAALLMGGKEDTADKDKAAASASAAVASASAAATDTPSPSASVAAAATDTATQSAAPAPPPSPATDNNGSSAGSKPTSSPATAKPTTTVAAAAPTQPAVPDVPAAPPAAPAAAAPAADQPFNMGAAKASLGAIAGAVQGCKRGDTTGSGRVVVTFAPSGAVQSAVVTDPPFAGTPTGSCVASRFRSAHVPSFSGSPFEVAKHFTIN